MPGKLKLLVAGVTLLAVFTLAGCGYAGMNAETASSEESFAAGSVPTQSVESESLTVEASADPVQESSKESGSARGDADSGTKPARSQGGDERLTESAESQDEDRSSAESTESQGGDRSSAESTESQGEDRIRRDIRLGFAGDVLLTERNTAWYDAGGVDNIVGPGLLDYMTSTDLMTVNEEFPFSDRGEPMEGKEFTFKAATQYTSYLTDLGIDLVSLANNHALDYGTDAFLDTMDALDAAGIAYIGGGHDIEEASRPYTFEVSGVKFAVFAASRVIPVHTWNAGKSSPGMFTTYSPQALDRAITAAKETADYCIVFVHWGVERNDYIEDYQRSLAASYIDAGADLVLGSHAHVMQGMEFIKGIPVVYGMGNYLFGGNTGDSMYVEATFPADVSGPPTVQVFPCKYTKHILEINDNPQPVYDHLNEISYNGAYLDAEGYLKEGGQDGEDCDDRAHRGDGRR